jgi:transcriptional regulator GlxA family with amidase domain
VSGLFPLLCDNHLIIYPAGVFLKKFFLEMAPIQFGMLLIPFQLLDVAAPLDILSSVSIPYLTSLASMGVPPALASKGIDIEFHHIGLTMDPVTHTAGFKSYPTCTVQDCPQLDYLLIGGPEPSYIKSLLPQMAQFIHERAEEVKTLFTTCTGSIVVAATGLLDGKSATTNHAAVPMAAQIFPQVKWSADNQWVSPLP